MILHRRQNRVIRIFISSTFVDMNVERGLLQSRIIPEIKKHCASKGWQFECVDLRWGVSQEAQEQSKTIQICMNEIRHCRDVSPKPNFIVLLGERYGWIPDGSSISATEMEVYEGLLSQEYLSGNTIVYDRVITDLPLSLKKDYVEVYASDKVQSLKQRLHKFVPQEGIYNVQVPFQTYLSIDFEHQFVARMTQMLKDLVNKEITEYANLNDYIVEEIFQDNILKTRSKDKYSEEVSMIELIPSKIIAVRTTDDKKRLDILSEFALRHKEECFFRSLGRSWMSSDGGGFLRSFLKHYGIRFFPSDSTRKLAEKVRSMFRFPEYYKVQPPKYIVIDSFDNLSPVDILTFFTWVNCSTSSAKIVLSLSDTGYLEHLHPDQFQIVNFKEDDLYIYSDFKLALDYVCSPENNSSTFVSIVTGLLCYSHSGVTEDELLEIAAMDSEYYNELVSTSKHDLPVLEGALQRVPYSIWSILYYHIGNMLVMRNSFGATTFVFDNDNYKEFAQLYFGSELKEKIHRLLIRYFNTEHAYRSVRALDELPHAYLAVKEYGELYRLINDPSFCQRLVSNGLGKALMDYVNILRRELADDPTAQTYLSNLSCFLVKDIDILAKYAKFDKSIFAKRFNAFLSENSNNPHHKYQQQSIYLRECSPASRITNGIALIVAYPEDNESLCEVIDIETGSVIAMRYIDVDVIIQDKHSYTGTLKMSYIDLDMSIVYIYDDHGYMNIWNYKLNTLEKIKSGYLDKMPQVGDTAFDIPKDFILEKEEQIISSGIVDSRSFYVVTCHSLRLLSRNQEYNKV